MSRYENQLFDYFTKVSRQNIARPLNLGGYSYSGGGEGGPAGGYLGVLPQNRVAYDYTEATISGFINPSGYSLVDNLNHIRYNVKNLQDDVAAIVTSGNMGVTIEHNGIIVAEHVLVVDTTGYLTATDDGLGHVTLDVTISGNASTTTVASGVYNEVPAGALPTDDFTTDYDFRSGTLQVYWNGVRQDPNDISITGPNTFTTAFTVTSPDTIYVDYETMVASTAGGGGGTMNHSALSNLSADDHPQYLTSGRGDTRYYGKTYIDALMALTITDSDYDAKGTLLVGSGYQAPIPLHVGTNGYVLTADSTLAAGMGWKPAGAVVMNNLNDLLDVDVPYPYDQDVLTYQMSTNTWVASGIGGGVYNNVSYFSPDVAPSSADAQNDEFSDSTLSASWTEWDYANRCTVIEEEYGLDVVQGYYVTHGFGGVYKTTPGGSTWTVETKVSLGHSYVSSGIGGIMLLENPVVSSGRAFFFGPVKSASGVRLEASLWTSYNTLDNTFASYNWTMPGIDPTYLRVVKCGTDQYQFWSSTDGFAWSCLYNGSLILFNPTAIGLVVGNWTLIDVGGIFHFYRVRNNHSSTDHEPTYGRRVTI